MSYRPSSHAPRHFLAALVAALLIAFSVPAAASGGDARALPASLQEAAPQLELLGEGRLTWWGFHVYDARLYAAEESFGYDRAFALELAYARDFTSEDIVEVSIEEMARLSGAGEARLAEWRNDMAMIFPDVGEGDRLIGHYDGAGTTTFYDATGAIGRIEDPDFARAFFAIWFDPDTETAELRRDLLGATAIDTEPGEARNTGFSPTN